MTRAETDAQAGARDDVLEQLHEISAQLATVKEQLARHHDNDQRDA